MGKHKNKLPKVEKVEEEEVPELEWAEEVVESVHNGENAEKKKKGGGGEEYRKTLETKRNFNIMSYDECVELMNTNPKSGLVEIVERRHFALPFHIADGNVVKSLEYVANCNIGKYKKDIGGVCFAVASIEPYTMPRILDDQIVFHQDFDVKQIVFRPVVNSTYEAVVRHVAEGFVSCLILKCIQFRIKNDHHLKTALNGQDCEQGDVLLVKHRGISIKSVVCTMSGQAVKMLTKAGGKREMFNRKRKFEEEEEVVEVANDVSIVEEPAVKRRKGEDGEVEEIKEKKKKKKHVKEEEEVEPPVEEEVEVVPRKHKKAKKSKRNEEEREDVESVVVKEEEPSFVEDSSREKKKKKRKHREEEVEEVEEVKQVEEVIPVEQPSPKKKKKNKFADFSDSD